VLNRLINCSMIRTLKISSLLVAVIPVLNTGCFRDTTDNNSAALIESQLAANEAPIDRVHKEMASLKSIP
jgi:hypothetical protein